MTTQVIATGFSGIGDAFYQRPFVKELVRKYDQVILATPWPQVFWDMRENIVFAEPSPHYLKLRTQGLNVERMKKEFGLVFAQYPRCHIDYQFRYKWTDPFMESMERGTFPLEIFDFDFPIPSSAYEAVKPILDKATEDDKPICVLRYPVYRRDWVATSRNCMPEHINFLVKAFEHEFTFVSVGYEQEGHEWHEGKCPLSCINFNKGELEIAEIAALLKHAKVSISTPGFFTPMSIAVGAKNLTIYGGFQRPDQHIDMRMNLMNYRFVAPDPFCNCYVLQHDCYKDIGPARLMAAFEELL